MTYINPARQDNVYIGKVDREWKLFAPAVLAVDLEGFPGYNGSELHSSNFVSTFSDKLSFSKLYDFIKSHKQFVYNTVESL